MITSINLEECILAELHQDQCENDDNAILQRHCLRSTMIELEQSAMDRGMRVDRYANPFDPIAYPSEYKAFRRGFLFNRKNRRGSK